MPATSKPLGFNCPLCGKDYGSIQFLRQMKNKITKRRNFADDLDTIHISKRKSLHPVEYSLRNKIIANIEEKLLDKKMKDLESINLTGPFLPPLVEAEKQVLEKHRSILTQREEARRLYVKSTQDHKWDVVERSKDLDPAIYQLTRSLGGDDIKVKKVNQKKSTLKTNYEIIRWNPIKQIKRYRISIDCLRHIDFDIDFCSIFLAKYRSVAKLLEDNQIIFSKAFDVIDEYRKQFSDRNYHYTYFEWFWIVRYAQVTTPRMTVKMLMALDGEGGKISTKHIKNMMKSVLTFWHKFTEYGPYFFNFIKYMHYLIEKDPQLKTMYTKTQQHHDEIDRRYVMEMLDKHLQGLFLYQDSDNYVNDYFQGIKDDDFKVSKLSEPRVRIYHSNPNYKMEVNQYQEEMKDFNLRLKIKEPKKPNKKTSCTFSPAKLPIDVWIRLHEQGKVPIIQANLINEL